MSTQEHSLTSRRHAADAVNWTTALETNYRFGTGTCTDVHTGAAQTVYKYIRAACPPFS